MMRNGNSSATLVLKGSRSSRTTPSSRCSSPSALNIRRKMWLRQWNRNLRPKLVLDSVAMYWQGKLAVVQHSLDAARSSHSSSVVQTWLTKLFFSAQQLLSTCESFWSFSMTCRMRTVSDLTGGLESMNSWFTTKLRSPSPQVSRTAGLLVQKPWWSIVACCEPSFILLIDFSWSVLAREALARLR